MVVVVESYQRPLDRRSIALFEGEGAGVGTGLEDEQAPLAGAVFPVEGGASVRGHGPSVAANHHQGLGVNPLLPVE